MWNSIITPETGWEYERRKKENESCHAHRAKPKVPFGEVKLPLLPLFYHLFILESQKNHDAANLFFLPPFKFLVNMFSLVFKVYTGEDVLGVFILKFRTLIAVGYTFLKSSSCFYTLHLLPVGSLWFPLVSEGQSCRGDGTCASEGKQKLKGRKQQKKQKNKCVYVESRD